VKIVLVVVLGTSLECLIAKIVLQDVSGLLKAQVPVKIVHLGLQPIPPDLKAANNVLWEHSPLLKVLLFAGSALLASIQPVTPLGATPAMLANFLVHQGPPPVQTALLVHTARLRQTQRSEPPSVSSVQPVNFNLCRSRATAMIVPPEGSPTLPGRALAPAVLLGVQAQSEAPSASTASQAQLLLSVVQGQHAVSAAWERFQVSLLPLFAANALSASLTM